jgi:hypothetical protein
MGAAIYILALMAAVSVSATPARPVALVPHAVVQADRLDLAALLPPTAPEWLRERARQIDLGPAPRPGWSRQLPGVHLEQQLPADVAAAVRIPAVVTVERTARLLRPEEILEAIRHRLGGNPAWPAEVLQTLPVQFPGLAVGDPHRVELRAVHYDAALGCVVFDLRVTGPGGIQQFEATAPMPAARAREFLRLDGPADRSRTVHSARANPRRTQRLPVLVQPGRPVALLLLGPQVEVVTRAVPLERGSAGQIIRARLSTTRRIVRARVAAGGWLEASIL